MMKVPSNQNDDELIHTRQTLLERLKDLDDTPSWHEFFEIYWRLIYNVARKFGLSDCEAQEVVQETVISVSRNIEKFECNSERGSFKGWLLRMTRWRILDQVRKRDRHLHQFANNLAMGEEERRTEAIDRIPDPKGNGLDSMWEEEWRSNLRALAMQRIRHRVDPMHYQVFYLNTLKEIPVKKICEMFDIPAGRIYVIKNRVSTLIRKEIRALESLPDSTPLPTLEEEEQPQLWVDKGSGI